MNKFIFIILGVVIAQTYSITECNCAQLLVQSDCTERKSLGCAWNSKTSTCANGTTQVVTTKYVAYCDSFTEITCPQMTPCAWVDGSCTFFTSCTPYAKTSNQECKAISTRCITDGTHCVEVTTCGAFTKQVPCVVNSEGGYCYWDSDKCVDASTCDQLPKSLTTDTLCRAQISTCTTTGLGCKISGTTCSDQLTEITCVWNYTMSQACYWTGSECVDQNCTNAPTSYKTDQLCKAFDETCTTKSGGGCIVRSTCDAAQVQAACLTNSSGRLCYWNATKCLDRTCSNAPLTFTTNQACSEFLSVCITNGAGCVTNTTCESAKIELACVKNAAGTPCIWDVICKEKTCKNAPTNKTTHELCNSYLSTCTVNSTGNGCQDRTCSNAPNSLITNQDCESYLPKLNCITKLGGGCVTNTTCAAINISVACLNDVNGTVCFWDTTSATCKNKTCTNAPNTYNDDSTCQQFLKTCTVAANGQGCVNRTCENLLNTSICTNDLNNQPCIYKGLCYQKQCALAYQSFTTHLECNNYLSSCTVSNTGQGCAPIPTICSAITIKSGCVLKSNVGSTYGKCGWNGTVCIDQGCATIQNATTTLVCNAIVQNCVSANPVNGVVQGCIDLPITCDARKTSDNCAISRTGFPTCLWNSNTQTCVLKSCLTAMDTGIGGYLTVANADNCKNYLSGCLVSNDAKSCIAQVTDCGTLTSTANCIDGAKVNGNCYFNQIQNKCQDKTCLNIDKTNHKDCNLILNTCTVNVNNNGCTPLTACVSYTTFNQCVINQQNQYCQWDSVNGKCINGLCTSAPDSVSYNSDSECSSYPAAANKCTVIQKVYDTKGCEQKQVNCTDYLDQNQCVKTLSGVNCLWHNNICWIKSTFLCTNITLPSYADPACEQIAYYCKGNGSSGCINKVCADYTKVNGLSTGTAISANSECQSLNSSCVLGTGACQNMKATCDLYTSTTCFISTAGTCVWQTSGTPACILASTSSCSSFVGADDTACKNFGFCKAGAGATATTPCVGVSCSEFVDSSGSTLTYSVCQGKNTKCVNTADNKSCQAANTCESYNQSKCTYNTTGQKCFWNSAALPSPICITITSETCNLIVKGGSSLIKEDCQGYSTSCIAKRDGSTCISIPSTCDSITNINECVESAIGTCIQSQASDSGAVCKDVIGSTSCTALFLKSGTTYNQITCTKLLSSCTNTGTTGCIPKTCDNAVSKTSFNDCNGWLSTCTYNGSTCITISSTCSSQLPTACYHAAEGECVVTTTNFCVKKTCDTAYPYSNYSTDTLCSNYLSTCTVARLGGCQARTLCNAYKSELQCKYNIQGKPCTWNSVTLTCIDLTCSNLDSTRYTSHQLCYTVINPPICTIKSNNGIASTGCVDLADCSKYIQAQCYYNASGQPCQWNTNLDIPTCQDKACSTASNQTIKSHADCQNYLKLCTVQATITDNVVTLGGCIPLASCSTYIAQEQCNIDVQGNQCGWNGQSCNDKSCATAPNDLNTNAKCRAYLPNCTVNASSQGCIEIPTNCEEYSIEAQCFYNLAGQPCYWTNDNSCVTRTCDNAPTDTADAAGCNSYLSGCTMDSIKCKTKICEDFILTTDELCAAAMPSCTSNGINCVLRGTCIQAQTKIGCVTQSDGKQCQWITETGYCTIRTCANATNDLITETQCASYLKGCTTKQGGGCVIKSTCIAASVESACTKDVDGGKCVWDAGACRNEGCMDYAGISIPACQLLDKSCTIGLNGKCATMNTCEQTTLRTACIIGTDGPCLWIEGYQNTDGTTGACFRYQDCKSLQWKTNSQCNLISNNCTTNGINCIGISLCSETNTNGGCVKGYDGTCIQSVTTLESTSQPVCYLYTSCNQALYTTHIACQNSNPKCTTDGSKGCIALDKCSAYTKAGCVINSEGAKISSGLITSTGVCAWDDSTNQCRDQNCTDLQGTSHSVCNAQLSTCTSDGTTCLPMAACSTYDTQIACQIALSSDGICFWQAATLTTTANCRLKVCSDIESGTTTAICKAGLSNCVSNGTKCITKTACASYTMKAACNSGGSDGICVFTPATASTVVNSGTCALMSSCDQANNDSIACGLASDRCAWTAAVTTGNTTTTASSCSLFTCPIYNKVKGACNNFLNWNKTEQTVCQLINSICTPIDPATLTASTCYSVSGYTYTWNSSKVMCQVCQASTVINNTNQTTNNTSIVTNQTTSFGQVLCVAILIMVMI